MRKRQRSSKCLDRPRKLPLSASCLAPWLSSWMVVGFHWWNPSSLAILRQYATSAAQAQSAISSATFDFCYSRYSPGVARKHRYRKNSSHKAHACNHTCAKDSLNIEYVVMWEDEIQQPQAWIRALSFVSAGEEFFTNYGPDFGLESRFCHMHEGEKVSGGVV